MDTEKTKPSASARKQRKRQDVKNQILEAACHCILENGIHDTNAQAIADYLGISQAKIFYYFPKQTQLFDELFGYIIECGRIYSLKAMQNAARQKTYIDSLKAYLSSQLNWAKDRPQHIGVLILTILESRHRPEPAKTLDLALDHGLETILSQIAKAIVEDGANARIKPRLLATILHRSLMGFMLDIYRCPDRDLVEEYSGALRQIIIDNLGD